MRGASELYTSGYIDEELDAWAARIRAWKRDVYVYFDNDCKVRAPFNALRLARRLGVQVETGGFQKTA